MSDRDRSDFVAIRSSDRLGYRVVGLCVAVALAIVVLLAVVGAPIVDRWLTERVAPVATDRAVPVVRSAPAERPLVTGGQAAVAIGDEAEWITNDDYPVESIRAEEQGRTTVRWVIGVDGRVADCGIVETSGYPRLDAAACAAITRSARYAPARDARGNAVRTTKTRRVRWVLPTS